MQISSISVIKTTERKAAMWLLNFSWYHTLQVKFDLLVWFSYFFGSVFEYIHCNKYQNCNKFQPTDSELKFNSHIAAFLSVVLITEMLEICIQTSYDQNVQLILNSYLPVVYGTSLSTGALTTGGWYHRWLIVHQPRYLPRNCNKNVVDWWTIIWLRFYYNHCVDNTDGGLLVDYAFITNTVSIPRLMDC
jgi:hypothetical protein